MSRVLMAVAIDDWGAGPLAAKEAAMMRLEPLGNVQVLKVKVEGDEQLALTGPPREPSEAGRVGRGGARERAAFSP